MVRRASATMAAALGVLSLATWLATNGACLQVSGLGQITILEDAGAPVACKPGSIATTIPLCDDHNPCTTDTCSGAEVCVFTPVTDGPAPAADQIKGDCQQIVCTGGQASSQPDDSDVPVNDCAVTPCSMGVVGTPVPKQDGTPCVDMGLSGTCAAGACVIACMDAKSCMPSPPNPCVAPSCDLTTGKCSFPALPDGTPTPGVTPGTGGCQTHLCESGADTLVPSAADTACSTYMTDKAGFCDGKGTCAQCTKDSECPGPTCSGSTVVKGDVCTAGVCTVPTPSTMDCTPYPCAGGACSTACTTDTDCAGTAYCSAGHCTARQTNGAACTATDQCQSGVCVDGVCCNNTCTGTCQACSAVKKGQGTDGSCGAVKAGLDPHSQCLAKSMATCGDSGGCNGAGACSLWPATTTCLQASCKTATLATKAADCDGAGNCVVPAPQDCTPYLCSGGVCGTACMQDTDCAPTAFCNAGGCQAQFGSGSPCLANDQCTSEACLDNECL